MKENYQKMLDEKIERCRENGEKPSLLLHVCCAPCSSYVLEYIASVFNITAYFYNPNISSEEEFSKRERELERFVREFGLKDVKIVTEKYDHAEFLRIAKGKENVPEGGERCYDCYALRLERTAQAAKAGRFDLFTTTLSISPHKNAEWLNEIGQKMGEKYGVEYLFSDFKKKNGYKRSCELSREYNLYRQSFCGCEFSQAEAMQREKGTAYSLNPVIYTKRLTLRSFQKDDAEAVYKNWAWDERVARYCKWHPHESVLQTRDFLKSCIDKQYSWAICLNGSSEPIGGIDLVGKNDFGVYEIGYVLSHDYWGNGIMTEALEAVIERLFSCGFEKLGACHHIDNPSSGRVMEKCGMKYVKSFMTQVKFGSEEKCEVKYYEINKLSQSV